MWNCWPHSMLKCGMASLFRSTRRSKRSILQTCWAGRCWNGCLDLQYVMRHPNNEKEWTLGDLIQHQYVELLAPFDVEMRDGEPLPIDTPKQAQYTADMLGRALLERLPRPAIRNAASEQRKGMDAG